MSKEKPDDDNYDPQIECDAHLTALHRILEACDTVSVMLDYESHENDLIKREHIRQEVLREHGALVAGVATIEYLDWRSETLIRDLLPEWKVQDE